MKIKDQVCSLENAKILKKFDVNQKSIFYFVFNEKTKKFDLSYGIKKGCETYSAFTMSELLNILPASIYNDRLCDLTIKKTQSVPQYICYYDGGVEIKNIYFDKNTVKFPITRNFYFYSENVVDCLANLVINVINRTDL